MASVHKSEDSMLTGTQDRMEADKQDTQPVNLISRRLAPSPLTRSTPSSPARDLRRTHLLKLQVSLTGCNLRQYSCGTLRHRATSCPVGDELVTTLRAHEKVVYTTESLEPLNATENASRMDADTTRPMRQVHATSARSYTFRCY